MSDPTDASGVVSALDAAAVDGAVARPDGSVGDARTAPFCDASALDLVVCYRFEGNLDDESGNSNHGASSTESYDIGVDGMALRTLGSTEIDVAESVTLDVAVLTIETWIFPEALPSGSGRVGVFDNNGQYGLFILSGGALQCSGAGVALSVSGVIAPDTWTHIACSYSGDTWTGYVNGINVGEQAGGGALSQTNPNGSALAGNAPSGDPFIGLLDNFRLWSAVRTSAELCAAAGC